MARPKKAVKKREKKNVPVGIAHIQASFNNTIITFTRYPWQCRELGLFRPERLQGFA